MKHCKEGKSVLNPGLRVLSDCFLFLIIISGFLQAQTPINGFCRFESYKIHNGFSNLLSINFNEDSYSDLLFFGSDQNNVLTVKGFENGQFTSAKIHKLPFEITRLKSLESSSSSGNLYAFIARTARTIGILKVSSSGSVSLVSDKKVDYFPDNLTVADINNDGRKEILVSGGAFEGVSAFFIINGRLEEKKVISKRLFSQMVVTDLNRDNIPDIAVFDLLDNSIKFFYNNSLGDFYEVRQFRTYGKISMLISFDYNLDGIQDIIYTYNNKVHFIFGDYRSAFNNTLAVQLENQIDDLCFGDFNRDGLIDIAYLSKNRSLLSIAFSKVLSRFYSEIQYLSRNGITKIIPFYSKYVHGLIALSSLGEYYMISEFNAVRDNMKISLGISPSLINSFDANKDGIPDICYYDEAGPSLNLLVRDNDGIPFRFYSIHLEDKCTDLEISDQKGRNQLFYCYSKGKKLIEIVSVNYQKRSYEVEKIYSAEPIEDLKIKQSEDGGKPLIYILSKSNGSLRLFCYRYSNFRYTLSSSGVLALNVLQAKLVVNNPVATLFFWKKDKKGIAFNKIFINNDLSSQGSSARYVLPLKSNMEIFNFTGDIFNDNINESLNFVFSNDSKFAIVSSGNSCYRLSMQGSLKDLNLKLKGPVFSMENRTTGLNELFVFNSSSRTLEKFDLLNKQKILLGKKIVETIDPVSYFVRSLNTDKYHLVYTDKAENCIKIKEISF